jgi:1-acyl-sn-glycerol-3-phosphate acyltransferase
MVVPAGLRVPVAALGFALNTVAHTLPLLALALVKLVVPVARVRASLGRVLVGMAESWIAMNGALIHAFTPTRVSLSGVALDRLGYRASRLVLSNHQSWVDIPVLQQVFNRRIAFLRFFLKQQLIWVPLLGATWWALDFPFMRRHSQAAIARRPELASADRDATRRACRRFRDTPVSIMNFAEGTRFTERKRVEQPSPFRHLLRPKSGGIAYVLDAMGDLLVDIVDVTIVYPGGRPSFVDLLVGRIREVRVHVQTRDVPRELLTGDYAGDANVRRAFQDWLNGIWAEKDQRIEHMLASDAAG